MITRRPPANSTWYIQGFFSDINNLTVCILRRITLSIFPPVLIHHCIIRIVSHQWSTFLASVVFKTMITDKVVKFSFELHVSDLRFNPLSGLANLQELHNDYRII